MRTVEPGGQLKPGPHRMQSMAPGLGWYVVAGQLLHEALEKLDAKVPGLHFVGSLAPTPHAAPGGHARHSSTELSPLALPKRPLTHGRAAGEPMARARPPGPGPACCSARIGNLGDVAQILLNFF